MENDFFLNAGIPPPLHFEQTSSMPTWRSSFSTAMDIQAATATADNQNCSSEQSPDYFYNPNWDNKSTDQNIHFESALSSMVSSPAASNSNMSNESFVIRELIGKLGNIGNTGEISPHLGKIQANSYMGRSSNGNASTNTSCYSTPLNSPPKLNLPNTDHHHHWKKEKVPNSGKSMHLNSSVAEFSADPGFAERAAKFSCFGSRSFNGRTAQLGGINNNNSSCNTEMPYRSNASMGNGGKLPRVSSSPSLKALGSQQEKMTSFMQDHRNELQNSREESTISEQNPNGEIGLAAAASNSMDLNSRKRKSLSKGKSKEPQPISPSPTATKGAEIDESSNAKRSKPNENDQNGSVKAEDDAKGTTSSGGADEKQTKTAQKLPEPPKDYIHVRARRGQATDSHSLAERVRREKISERMKLLQDLVPGCNKVTGKALMLDEIINYVQSLQRQVEFLSMKLSSVNSRLDFNVETLMSKEIFQQGNNGLPQQHQIFPLDSSAQAIYGHQRQQNPALQNNHISNGTVDPLDTSLCQSLGMQLPPLSGFSSEGIPQFSAFGEDDLQTIVQMGFGQNTNKETELDGSNQVSHMKIEL